jgi:hypothetical protein
MHLPFVPNLSENVDQHLQAGNGTIAFGPYTQAEDTT